MCIFDTHVANQMPDDLKNKLMENIRIIGANRDVFHLYNNVQDTGKLHVDYFINGEEFNQVIGETDGHKKLVYLGIKCVMFLRYRVEN